MHRTSLRTARVLAFVGGLAVILLYALRGGSYDVVTFEEYGLVIWWVLAIGIAVGVLPRAHPSRATLALLGALLAYTAWTAASLIWSQSSERTTIEVARSLDYLGLAALLAATLDRDTWRAAASGLGCGALVVCALALMSRLIPSAFPTDYVASSLHTDRLSYPLGYWNAVGAWGAMSIAIALGWSAHDRSRVRRAAVLALVPVAGAVVYLTYSRAAVAGSVLAAALVIAFSRNRLAAIAHTLLAVGGTAIGVFAIRAAPQVATATGTRGAGGVAAAVIAGAAIAAAGGAATGALGLDRVSMPPAAARPLGAIGLLIVLIPAAAFGPRVATRAWHSFTHPVKTSTADPAGRLLNLSGSRYLVWKAAVKSFEHSPATGTGAGTFAFWWNEHATDYEFLHDAHNIWLQNMAELGAVGLLGIIGVAISSAAVAVLARLRARRRSSAGIATGMLVAFVVYLMHASVDWMWESTAVTVLALGGVAVLSGRLASRRRRLGWPVRTALVAFAAAACAFQVPGLLSTAEIRRSQTAERHGDGPTALAWAADAISAEPWSASAYEQRGLVEEASGEYGRAASDLHSAISREPENFVHWLLLARIETERGHVADAASDYREAHRLRPLASAFVYAPYFSAAPANRGAP